MASLFFGAADLSCSAESKLSEAGTYRMQVKTQHEVSTAATRTVSREAMLEAFTQEGSYYQNIKEPQETYTTAANVNRVVTYG